MSDSSRIYRSQQTVKLAVDTESGELVPAESLLSLDEAVFSEMRRAAMNERITRKRGGTAARFQCAICKQPLYLSRRREGHANRWFAHADKAEHCPWYERNRLSPEQTKALIYRGQQEGAQHRALKEFLAHWLENDQRVTNVDQEKTTFSAVVRGEWRRPDVKCTFDGKTVVFEIQLSYTFLSDVIARDAFYQREGVFIIWIFSRFDLNRAAVADEVFFNRRNVFVVDDEAMRHTKEHGRLMFSGVHQVPQIEGDQIHDAWTNTPVGLSDVVFPIDTFRPYFFDYSSAKADAERQLADCRAKNEQAVWSQGIHEYLTSATHYYESMYAEDDKLGVLESVVKLSAHKNWALQYRALSDENFFGWHAVLPVLLSIKLDRCIGYNLKSVYQVMEAGLRAGHRDAGKHAYAILYLWAYKVYKPTMTDKHRQWIKDYARDVQNSIESGDRAYCRYSGFDKAIGLLFPELQEHLASSFGQMPPSK